MAAKKNGKGKGGGVVRDAAGKAVRLPTTQLVVEGALFAKKSSTGKDGFFGKVIDPTTGRRYQVSVATALN